MGPRSVGYGASGDILPEEVPPVFVEPLRLIRSLEDRALRDGNDDLLRMVKVEKEKIVMAMGEWKAGEQ